MNGRRTRATEFFKIPENHRVSWFFIGLASLLRNDGFFYTGFYLNLFKFFRIVECLFLNAEFQMRVLCKFFCVSSVSFWFLRFLSLWNFDFSDYRDRVGLYSKITGISGIGERKLENKTSEASKFYLNIYQRIVNKK